MKVKLLEFLSPYNVEMKDAETFTDKDGKQKIKWGDNRKEVLLDEVKPMILETTNALKQRKKTLAYFKARDNFLSLDEEHFKVTGRLSDEQITEVAEFGAIEALAKYTANKGAMSGLFGKLLILLFIVAFLVGGYYIIQYITGGAIQLPKLI